MTTNEIIFIVLGLITLIWNLFFSKFQRNIDSYKLILQGKNFKLYVERKNLRDIFFHLLAGFLTYVYFGIWLFVMMIIILAASSFRIAFIK